MSIVGCGERTKLSVATLSGDLGTTCNCNLGNYDAEEFISKEESHDLPVYTKEELIAELGINDTTHFVDDVYQDYVNRLSSPMYSTKEEVFNEEVYIISEGGFLRPEVADELVEQSSSNKGSSGSNGSSNTGSTETAGNTSNTDSSNTGETAGVESPTVDEALSDEEAQAAMEAHNGFTSDGSGGTPYEYTEEDLRILETLH